MVGQIQTLSSIPASRLPRRRAPRNDRNAQGGNYAKQSQFAGLVQNRVTLSVKQSSLSVIVTCCAKGTYISFAPREGSHECYPGLSELEPCQFAGVLISANCCS